VKQGDAVVALCARTCCGPCSCLYSYPDCDPCCGPDCCPASALGDQPCHLLLLLVPSACLPSLPRWLRSLRHHTWSFGESLAANSTAQARDQGRESVMPTFCLRLWLGICACLRRWRPFVIFAHGTPMVPLQNQMSWSSGWCFKILLCPVLQSLLVIIPFRVRARVDASSAGPQVSEVGLICTSPWPSCSCSYWHNNLLQSKKLWLLLPLAVVAPALCCPQLHTRCHAAVMPGQEQCWGPESMTHE